MEIRGKVYSVWVFFVLVWIIYTEMFEIWDDMVMMGCHGGYMKFMG